MNISTDEHRATLAMLQEALAYLERLPRVPATHELCARLRAHLEKPTQRLVAQHARELHGLGPWTPQGLPLLEASLAGATLTVSLPKAMSDEARIKVLREIADRLSAGSVSLDLRPR